jgi:hypothetical protein
MLFQSGKLPHGMYAASGNDVTLTTSFAVSSLEGFVSNRDQSYEDPMEE